MNRQPHSSALLVPFTHEYTPYPNFLSAFQPPSYLSPFSKSQVPCPSIFPSFHSPSYLGSGFRVQGSRLRRSTSALIAHDLGIVARHSNYNGFGRPILQRPIVQITRALASLKSSEFRVIGGSVLPSPARPYIHPIAVWPPLGPPTLVHVPISP